MHGDHLAPWCGKTLRLIAQRDNLRAATISRLGGSNVGVLALVQG
jgi:hypothetical protein